MPVSARRLLVLLPLLAAAQMAVAGESPGQGTTPAPTPGTDAPHAFSGWRAGFIATAALNLDLDMTGSIGVGVYPWRWAGFELRHVWIGQKSGTFMFDANGAPVPAAPGGTERNMWTEGAIVELAFVARLRAWEPWVSAGRWSGHVSTSGPGGGIDICASLPCPSIGSSGSEPSAAVAPAAALGAGIRYRSQILIVGLEARRILFGKKTHRLEPGGLDVPLRDTFIGLTVGFAIGGPVERGE